MQSTQNATAGRIKVESFNHVPAFVGREIEQLYGSLFSSLLTMETGNADDDLRTCVMSVDGVTSHILLYRISGDCLRVANEGIKLGNREMQRFSEFVFSTYRNVNTIICHAIETEPGAYSCSPRVLHCPRLRHNCLEDMIISMPADVDTYLSSLGKSTRRTIKSYSGKMKKDHPSYRVETKEGQEIDDKDIDAILGYHRMRMARMGKASSIDHVEEERIRRMAKTNGMVCTMRIDDRIIGGTINYRIGDNFFGYVQGHDAEYERYRLGFTLCYVTVCECIRLGGKIMNLLWGRYEYKFLLGAQPRELDHVTIYRSHVQLLLHAKSALVDMSQGWKRQVGLWMQYELVKKNKTLANLLRQARSLMRDAGAEAKQAH